MPFEKTPIEGLLVYKPRIFEDSRGYFFESYNQKEFDAEGIEISFVQDNRSSSAKNTLRGLHYQLEPYAQAKLVTVFKGAVLDVAVDLRKGSATFKQAYTIELNAENKLQLLIPRGFAHGFLVLSDYAEFFYKCDNYYSKEHEGGIRYDDPTLGVNWGNIDQSDLILSEKDMQLPLFNEHEAPFSL